MHVRVYVCVMCGVCLVFLCVIFCARVAFVRVCCRCACVVCVCVHMWSEYVGPGCVVCVFVVCVSGVYWSCSFFWVGRPPFPPTPSRLKLRLFISSVYLSVCVLVQVSARACV